MLVRCLGMGERSVYGFEGGEIMLGSARARGLDGSDRKLPISNLLHPFSLRCVDKYSLLENNNL